MIPFNKPPVVGTEIEYLQQAIASGRLSGDGRFTRLCEQWLEQRFQAERVLLTPSCTDALELSALLLNTQPDDEIIMPSYTFVSTANAFSLRGAKIVFVDIRPDTMNIDESKIEQAITAKTKAIVVVHYAGVASEMQRIMSIAEKHQLWVVEDAAQGVMASYQNKPLGTIGHIGCYSFHETKNYTAGGEGGAIVINDAKLVERAEIIREKGTNRKQFFQKQVDKYTWRELGSSFLMSELQAAYLYAQLLSADQINQRRLALWQRYYTALTPLAEQGLVKLPHIPTACQPNGHLFYLKLADKQQRSALIEHLNKKGILAVFHYVPLHSSPAGQHWGTFVGEDCYTTQESEKLLRLPLFFNLTDNEITQVIDAVLDFFMNPNE
ncbi:dTDP-4-amino-4,6-dideoxygalactose transaminase [Ursidibacter maritimus]|uniref:dTDP-4-amino-4,6-dideoxygalactose transaminase n=1 Tax=Ursidibacter maritimus TaxID=1331689 RepID=UPI001C46A253|nr:dTDP-4-amino-4,6-dideoxygalactose transaminase [Ursidibacter maritimus]